MRDGLLALAVMLLLAIVVIKVGPKVAPDKFQETHEESGYKVQEIFQHEGCKGYSFKYQPHGREHYYVVCGDKVNTINDCSKDYKYHCQKTIPTIKEDK